MKRLFIALLVCVYIATSVFSAVLPVRSSAEENVGEIIEFSTDTEFEIFDAPVEDTTPAETTAPTEPSAPVATMAPAENTESVDWEISVQQEEIIAAEEPEDELTSAWMDYIDFTTCQMEKVFADPGMYVGYEAVFDMIWSNFQYAADPTTAIPAEADNLISWEEVQGTQGTGARVRIVGYAVDGEGKVWFEVEEMEGEELPEILKENPYILHIADINDTPSLIILPQKGMFIGETVELLRAPMAGSDSIQVPVTDLPTFFDVMYVDDNWYDVGNTGGARVQNGVEYRFVACESVLMVAPEVSHGYEMLMDTDSSQEYGEIWQGLAEGTRGEFTEAHLEDLNAHQENLKKKEYEALMKELEFSVVTDPTEETDPTVATDAPEFSVVTDPTENTELTENVEWDVMAEQDETNPEEDTSALAWMSYSDYTAKQTQKIYANPGLYVGYEAVFDLAWDAFQYAADPASTIPGPDVNLITDQGVMDDQGNALRVKITDYVVDAENQIWYKIEGAEGVTLPEILRENPYILHLSEEIPEPSLIIQPQKGMFVGEAVNISKEAAMASRYETVNTGEVPAFFDVIPLVDTHGQYWYDLGDVTGWNETLTEGYRYVWGEDVMLIPPEVTVAYERLMNAASAKEYLEIWNSLPESIRSKFTEKHQAALVEREEQFEDTEHSAVVEYNGVALNVSVTGRMPLLGVALQVSPVSNEMVMREGFDIHRGEDIITALDIKLLKEDGTEWQPEDGERVQIRIDMAPLGCPDGKVVTLHHKHGDHISKQDVFVVMDGMLTISTAGFSIFAVQDVGSNRQIQGTQVNNGGNASMTIGETRVYYFDTSGNNGTWIVDDPTGAIHYTVHSNETESANIGHNRVSALWIKIVALKETAQPITLTYTYRTNWGTSSETFSLNVTVPSANNGGVRLYLKDDVNRNGRLVATLVDQNGREIAGGLDGAAFSWSRDDNLFIVPEAYELNFRAVNIARDHGGLVEARKKADNSGYQPITYTVEVILANGTKLTADYTVYYQSEIINAGFEFPDSKYRDYSFFPNGYPELYWKTTAPGTGTDNITKDIEYADVTGQTNTNQGGTSYGVWRAADADEGGVQFAELNAEEVGALYQDIITAPHEEIVWEFAHARRPKQSWTNEVANRMYLVIGATETAQALTNAQLNELVRQAKKEAGNDADFLNCRTYVKTTFNGAEYCVWYHDADDQTDYTAAGNYGWETMEGSYEVPENQYRTRVFFVSDPDSNSNNKNAGNVIDSAVAGQYKTYLIEYYEQTYKDRELITTRFDDYEETGEALVYSSEKLENYDYFLETKHDYLYKILINGENYPYDIRYSGNASLYIQNYEGTPTDPLKQNKNYEGYDIVMQIFLRDTVVAVQKELQFPTTLTEEQKLSIMEDLNRNGGYKATFALDSIDGSYSYHQVGDAVITSRDPVGKYKGFIALGENPELNHNYQVEETNLTEIPGLELESVTFSVTRYSMGSKLNELLYESYTEERLNANERLICTPFRLEDKIKIADVNVVNQYKEKETTIYYKAIGNGKVSLDVENPNFEDIPKEELLYYSGQSIGAAIHEGNGATFEGWYKDEACTQPVTPVDGVWDKESGSFKPNANILNADEVTFYAKFITNSIVINRTNGEPGQSFVYHVSGTTEKSQNVDLYVTVTCDEKGNGSKEILEVLNGSYTITEVDEWSWRYEGDTQNVTVLGENAQEYKVGFGKGMDEPKWLNGLDLVKNVFGGSAQ